MMTQTKKPFGGGVGALGSGLQSRRWLYVQRDEPPWLFCLRAGS
jgi:hypothetical protein